MPSDNAAPPTQPRAESIVCTSLVLLSSPALPRRDDCLRIMAETHNSDYNACSSNNAVTSRSVVYVNVPARAPGRRCVGVRTIAMTKEWTTSATPELVNGTRLLINTTPTTSTSTSTTTTTTTTNTTIATTIQIALNCTNCTAGAANAGVFSKGQVHAERSLISK
uniref:Uncharacterized protein n=1 Tax=Vespula pensylvanica TaxID=30213 RepID=A0A834PGR7_VESPE|nr:hypothetical protein H0235_001764 [Vespula pensylvanica]